MRWRRSVSAPRLEASRHLRRGGAQRADACAELEGDLVDSYDPALKEHRTMCFLAFDGHCYMYRAVKRVQAARVLYRGEARQTLPPIGECSRACSGARTCARQGGSSWPWPQGGHQQPGAVLRAKAPEGTRCCGGGARRSTRSTGSPPPSWTSSFTGSQCARSPRRRSARCAEV